MGTYATKRQRSATGSGIFSQSPVMSNLDEEIKYMVEYFREIDNQLALVKKTNEYEQWDKKPVPTGKLADTKEFSLTLWKGTARERTITHRLAKVRQIRTGRR